MDFIEVYPEALPAEFCERLIEAFDSHSGVRAGETGHGIDNEKKNSQDLTLDSFPDLSGIKNELLGYTLNKASDYFVKYSMALMGAVSVAVADENWKVRFSFS